MYLTSIQHGIQTAHVVSELYRKYEYSLNICHSLFIMNHLKEWTELDKTIIVLNGGDTYTLEQDFTIFEKQRFPFVSFNEPGIGNAVTAIGIIVPARVYNANGWEYLTMSKEEKQLVDMLSSKRLAS
jgi:hypothetical protein